MRTVGRAVFALFVAAVTLGAARAQDACQADVEKLCQGIPPGGGRLLSCLKANEAKVSPGCKQAIAAVVKKAKAIGKACEGDVQQFCASTPAGGGAVLKCLASNSANLSAECKPIVDKAMEKAADFKKACGADAKKLCQGIPPGQGRILACLKSREADLSPSCQGIMK